MPTVRDLFLEALAMKVQDISSPKIREHLINKGHDIGHSQITEVGNENSYELTFDTGEKIRFDGIYYNFAGMTYHRSSNLAPSPPPQQLQQTQALWLNQAPRMVQTFQNP